MEKTSIRILSIDPSVMNYAGWALLILSLDDKGEIVEEWDFGSWAIDGKNLKVRCKDLVNYVLMEIKEFDHLVVEWPKFYEEQRGQVAARQGYTINLAAIAMYLAGWMAVEPTNLFLYTATDWKGNVSKAVTARRFFKMFNVDAMEYTQDAIDAAMMLVHHLKEEGANYLKQLQACKQNDNV